MTNGWKLRRGSCAHYNRGLRVVGFFLWIGVTVPIGTAVHDRTSKLCESMNYREWSGYYAVSVYEMHHDHEYNAIRNATAMIDVSPLYKYLLTGKDVDHRGGVANRVVF